MYLLCFITHKNKHVIFSSPELKELFCSPIVRRPSVCLLDFYIFDFFSRTAGPILTKAGKNHPLVKGTQNCTIEGQPPSPRGDNRKRVKKLLKI
jgi:hypothetical protein